MDADVMITVALCLEVFLFGFAGAVFIAREARNARREAASASAKVGAFRARPPVTTEPARARRPAVRGMHS